MSAAMEKQVAMSYATPIGRFRMPDAESVNRELRRIILDKEKTSPSDNYANVGGWHSSADLLEWPGESISTLKAWIMEAISHMVAVSTEGKAPRGMIRVVGWANVSRKGHYHRIHNHPSSAWSGVYYVDAGGEAPRLGWADGRSWSRMIGCRNPRSRRRLARGNRTGCRRWARRRRTVARTRRSASSRCRTTSSRHESGHHESRPDW